MYTTICKKDEAYFHSMAQRLRSGKDRDDKIIDDLIKMAAAQPWNLNVAGIPYLIQAIGNASDQALGHMKDLQNNVFWLHVDKG